MQAQLEDDGIAPGLQRSNGDGSRIDEAIHGETETLRNSEHVAKAGGIRAHGNDYPRSIARLRRILCKMLGQLSTNQRGGS